MIEVTNYVTCYEENDEEVKPGKDYKKLVVKSHWNYSDWIVLELDGHSITVNGRDLTSAIQNAMNKSY